MGAPMTERNLGSIQGLNLPRRRRRKLAKFARCMLLKACDQSIVGVAFSLGNAFYQLKRLLKTLTQIVLSRVDGVVASRQPMSLYHCLATPLLR